MMVSNSNKRKQTVPKSLWNYQSHIDSEQNKDENLETDDHLIIAKDASPEMIETNTSNQHIKQDSDGEEEGDDDEEEICQSDEDGENLDNPKLPSSPKAIESNLLTTITNSANDYKNKIEQKQSNKLATDCFDSNKMIYEKNESSSGHPAFNYHMLNNQQAPRTTISSNSYIDHNGIEKAKRHYNSEVDPARYRKVLEEGVTKFACSLCGNTYKWRKSLNKHWKEKHITEVPPPLDAPVTIKLRNGNTTINCIATGGNQAQCLPQSHSVNNSNMLQQRKLNQNKSSIIEKSHKHQLNKSPVDQSSPQLPFSPSLLVAAATAANAATSGSGQMPSGQLHPAYWTVFHSYLNSAALKSEQSSKFSINHLSTSSNHTNQSPESVASSMRENQPEVPLDLSMKPVMSRRSSINSNTSSNQSNDFHQHEHNECDNHKKPHKSRRSDFNMKQLLKQQKNSRSSSRCSSTSSVSVNSSKHSEINQTILGMKQDQYQSYTEDESMNLSQNLSAKNNQSSLSVTAATAYNQKLFVCSICDAKFHVVDHINEHFLKNHYDEYQRELSSKSPPRNTNVAQQNEEWNLSDPNNPLKCIKCDFVGRWPTELQKHAASHSTSRPFKCLICSLTYKWRWDLAKHFDRTHPNFRNPYKKRDRDAARSTLVGGSSSNSNNNNNSMDQEQENYPEHEESRSRSRSNSSCCSKNIQDYSRSVKKEAGANNCQKSNKHRLNGSQKLNGASSKQEPQMPLNLNQGLNNSSFNNSSLSPNQQQLANNPMMAYFAALQNNMFQQQQTPSSSTSSTQSNQISPFSLLQQQQKNPFLPSIQPPQFNQPDTSQNNNTATILAAAMAAIAQGGNDASSMSQLLPHLLQNLQNTSSSASSTSSSSSNNKIQENYNSNLLSPSSSSSSQSYSKKVKQPNAKKQKLNDSLLLKADQNDNDANQEKETRNFLCYWCDFRGRWRSEIIQHMRCHHAREKPYRCSACMYASNWKWDVQKHTKKQHPDNPNAKIIEISDQILFPDLKDLNFFENVKPTLPPSTPVNHKKLPQNLTPPNSSSVSSASSSSSNSSLNSKPYAKPKDETNNYKKMSNNHSTPKVESHKTSSKSLSCQQCPYVACNLSDLRRHLIVHSDEQPYHCCSCDFKSKWKSDVKKHQRNFNHTGPILVGKKAMQKVIESLGLDKNSMLTLYGPNIQVIDNKQCKSNEKLIDEDNISFQDSNKITFSNKSNDYIRNNQQRLENGMKRKQPESDNEELYEEQQYDEDDFEQLNEEDENVEDDYEQILAYQQNVNYEDDLIDEGVPFEGDENMLDEEDQLNEDYNQEEINSQCSDDNNCNDDLIENNLNEFEEEIDCV